MANWLQFDDLRNTDSNHGFHISGVNTFKGAERDVEMIPISGRNGDLIVDNGRFKNIEIVFDCFCNNGHASATIDYLRNKLSEKIGYYDLKDSYHPATMRKARFVGGLTPTMHQNNQSASFQLIFDCRPEQFLQGSMVSESVTITNGSGTYAINNTTLHEAKPYIYLRLANMGDTATIEMTSGEGALVIRNPRTVHIWVDCETMDVRGNGDKSSNLNDKVDVVNGFPYLKKGTTELFFSGVQMATVTPRLFTI